MTFTQVKQEASRLFYFIFFSDLLPVMGQPRDRLEDLLLWNFPLDAQANRHKTSLLMGQAMFLRLYKGRSSDMISRLLFICTSGKVRKVFKTLETQPDEPECVEMWSASLMSEVQILPGSETESIFRMVCV